MHSISRNRFVLAAMLTLALVASLARPSNAFLDKTRFAAHLGVAYFCFHHWVLGPYQSHAFDNGAPHRTATIVKGGAALLFAVHEVRVAEKIAHKSNSKILHALDGKLLALTASFAAVGTALKSGQFNPESIKSLAASTTSFNNDSSAAGEPIKDVAIPSLPSKPDDSDTSDDATK